LTRELGGTGLRGSLTVAPTVEPDPGNAGEGILGLLLPVNDIKEHA
jgi:hypothetical protein